MALSLGYFGFIGVGCVGVTKQLEQIRKRRVSFLCKHVESSIKPLRSASLKLSNGGNILSAMTRSILARVCVRMTTQ